jgi:SAM-dependent methyltransferase
MTISRWEELFLEDKRVLATPPSQAAERAAATFQRNGIDRILDLGCGVGRDSFYLAGCGLDVVGLDLAGSGIGLAEAARREKGVAVRFLQGDACRLPFPTGSFDGVYCFGLLHEFVGEGWEADVATVMGEIRRVLRPGGQVVLAVLAGDPTAGLPHAHLFSEAEFLSALRGFVVEERDCYADRGCTGREDYRVGYAVLHSQEIT